MFVGNKEFGQVREELLKQERERADKAKDKPLGVKAYENVISKRQESELEQMLKRK